MNIDFNFWLLVLIISSGIIAGIDKLKFAGRRYSSGNTQITKKGGSYYLSDQKNMLLEPPLLARYARSFFGMLLIVFILRGFFIGNFFIPSASMMPTLPVGSFILVDKTIYNIKNPLNNNVWIHIGRPKSGDIAVFSFPVNPNVNFVKRIIGLPGDIISYQDNKLTVNGKYIENSQCLNDQKNIYNEYKKYEKSICGEAIGNREYQVNRLEGVLKVNFINLVVPEGMYFVMGDNRDNSEDSRYWGFVSEKDLIGKAAFVWLSWDNLSSSIRWDRLGRIV